MNHSILFHLLIALFLVTSLKETTYKPQLPSPTHSNFKISTRVAFAIILCMFGAMIWFLLFGSKSIINLYIRGSFSLLVVGHMLWLTLNRSMYRKSFFVIFALGIIFLRFMYPSLITHNLFLFVALVWLGQFFTRIKLLTKRRFLIISLLWLLYDIVYVWLTPLSHEIAITTRSIGFPLSLSLGEQSIGSGDLLWATAYVSILPTLKTRWIGILTLWFSNVLLSLYAYITNSITIFPLLVLWVPLGLVLTKLFENLPNQTK